MIDRAPLGLVTAVIKWRNRISRSRMGQHRAASTGNDKGLNSV